ncbi:MAG: aspartate kinase [Candidatus Levybacteria bacterium RIFCSPHIGHO2_02_FULL_40_18]|nr:MAG: aspartate kinase [Candidatus Levybacteria bacterium RIFCSPHIGHO2_01_FULL_40_58]OGH26114.1 MAG: aspartate kinase [Candidatus Levybacteria bacterium RIFCSPHIGHO2_02_FULL_40_18]OGH32095.1 MAG: aspartate kinase [Candidatus Levybacteria bacterium RIFCSPHIGHO2_12_FULL_40_31]OGH39935.1 MAG: aspartate kinase [Candidatus Levybacteria bacterium RIFCSPLOWO2_01_FULL_40_64]OGH49589.1 MAG: aspartate kinase [Candidatus Levybacteria bacterium RIFCSPLOWO2_02_FULL_41_11]OGH53998.1 MAG: aspartate kinase 
MKKDKVVISLGGSLIVPNGGIDVTFLKKFNDFIRKQLAHNHGRQFFIVTGGGATTRHYQDAAQNVTGHELVPEDLDWLGIHATRLNAHLVRTIFRDLAHPYILKHYEIIRKVTESVVVASGWKPGWSTDFCSAMICEDYNVKTVINLSNIDMVYDSDPRHNPDARPIKKITWDKFRKIVGDKWVPGMNLPFDPIASKKAQELGLMVVILKGDNFENLEHYFAGREFVGTVIEG